MYVWALAVMSPESGRCCSALFAGTSNGIFRSTDDGKSWNHRTTGSIGPNVVAFALSKKNIFAATDGNGILLSADTGSSWSDVNLGLLHWNVTSLAINGTSLFAGILGGGVWRRPLSEMISSVDIASNGIPSRFSLGQNYPNPFNSSTIIHYELPRLSHAKLTVYDIVGREVGVLVNQIEGPGHKYVIVDASRFSSGVYYYRLQAGIYTDTKKFLLLR
jgi:hypothetical protein